MNDFPSSKTVRQEFEKALIEYISQEWGHHLGKHLNLLTENHGFEKIAKMLRSGKIKSTLS